MIVNNFKFVSDIKKILKVFLLLYLREQLKRI